MNEPTPERLAHDYLLRTAASRRTADKLGVPPLIKFARVWLPNHIASVVETEDEK